MNQPSVYIYPLPFEPPTPPLSVDTEPLFEFPEPDSKFPLAIYFTYGNVSFHVTLSPYIFIRDIHFYTNVSSHVIASQMTQLLYKHSTYKFVGHVGVFHFIALILSGLKLASMAIWSDGSVFLSLCSSQGSNTTLHSQGETSGLYFAWS